MALARLPTLCSSCQPFHFFHPFLQHAVRRIAMQIRYWLFGMQAGAGQTDIFQHSQEAGKMPARLMLCFKAPGPHPPGGSCNTVGAAILRNVSLKEGGGYQIPSFADFRRSKTEHVVQVAACRDSRYALNSTNDLLRCRLPSSGLPSVVVPTWAQKKPGAVDQPNAGRDTATVNNATALGAKGLAYRGSPGPGSSKPSRRKWRGESRHETNPI